YSTPNVPINLKKIRLVSTCLACLFRKVVRPYEPLAFSYARLPARKEVPPMIATARAHTLSRSRVRLRRSFFIRFFNSGRRLPKSTSCVNFFSLRSRAHLGWYRYCLRPLASIPVACRWPFGDGHIHTFCQAGGMTSERIRFSVCSLVMRVPFWST